MRLFLGAATALLLFVAGCAAPREAVTPPGELPSEFPHHSADDVIGMITDDAAHLDAFSARGTLTLQSPSQRGTYNATIRNRRADSLYLSAGQFGFEGLRALVTPDSFYVYDLLRNRVTYGDVETAGSAFPIPIGADDVFQSLIGVVVPEAGTDWRISASGRYYTLSDQVRRRTLVVDPSIWRVIRYEERNGEGDLVEERLYSDFGMHGGMLLPGRVAFNVPAQDTRVTLVYRSIEVNPGNLNFDIRVSNSASRIPAGT
jgi:hypothetical protein